ncbi:MAG: hypothetical protein D6771_04495 [Zetaproteobacteria bacterium]|nr:MAG: hypothetical protein D6771_04495 [Zetaproteobacteria bacterium]
MLVVAAATQAAEPTASDMDRARKDTARAMMRVQPHGGLPNVQVDPYVQGAVGEVLDRAWERARRQRAPIRTARRRVEAWVLVSSSVPRASLVRLLRDARLAGVPVVVRGFPEEGGRPSFVAMRRFVRSLGEDAALFVDPRPFRRFGVTRVPAFVVDGEVVQGDVSLDYALRWLRDHRPRARAGAEALLRRMEVR